MVRPVRQLAVVVVMLAALVVPMACSTSCDRGVATAVFDGTLQNVGADGVVTLHVDTVALGPVAAGSVVTVRFPADQVDQLRRDTGKVYRVRANGPTDRLTAEVSSFDHTCGDTKLAHE